MDVSTFKAKPALREFVPNYINLCSAPQVKPNVTDSVQPHSPISNLCSCTVWQPWTTPPAVSALSPAAYRAAEGYPPAAAHSTAASPSSYAASPRLLPRRPPNSPGRPPRPTTSLHRDPPGAARPGWGGSPERPPSSALRTERARPAGGAPLRTPTRGPSSPHRRASPNTGVPSPPPTQRRQHPRQLHHGTCGHGASHPPRPDVRHPAPATLIGSSPSQRAEGQRPLSYWLPGGEHALLSRAGLGGPGRRWVAAGACPVRSPLNSDSGVSAALWGAAGSGGGGHLGRCLRDLPGLCPSRGAGAGNTGGGCWKRRLKGTPGLRNGVSAELGLLFAAIAGVCYRLGHVSRARFCAPAAPMGCGVWHRYVIVTVCFVRAGRGVGHARARGLSSSWVTCVDKAVSLVLWENSHFLVKAQLESRSISVSHWTELCLES